MSLDDTPKNPLDAMDKGDKVCTVLPEYSWGIIPDELDVMNHHKQSQSFFVEIIPSNALSNPPRKQRIVIHLMPVSRRDDLAPPEGS